MKYRNIKTNGYDSKKEAKRAFELAIMQKAGLIRDLQEQVTFRLEVNGQLICKYRADFVYKQGNELEPRIVVEDVKSPMTKKLPVYRLKKKLMKACLGIDITEV